MKFFKFLGATCLGALILPVVFAQGQEKKNTRIVNMIFEEQQTFRGGSVDRKMQAIDELFNVFGRLSDTVDAIANHGLFDPDEEIRVKSAVTLARIGPSAAKGTSVIHDLIRALEKDKAPRVRIHAASALGAILEDGSNPQRAKPAIKALRNAMKNDPDTLVRRSACSGLAWAGPNAHEAATDLLELMKSKDDDFMRELASRAFVDVACPAARKIVPTLTEMLKNGIDDPKTEGQILWALGRIGEPEEVIVPILIKTISDKKRTNVRGGALIAVMEMGPKAKATTAALIEALDMPASSPKQRQNATISVLRAIEAIGPDARAAIPAVTKLSMDPATSGLVRDKCAEVLKILQGDGEKERN